MYLRGVTLPLEVICPRKLNSARVSGELQTAVVKMLFHLRGNAEAVVFSLNIKIDTFHLLSTSTEQDFVKHISV